MRGLMDCRRATVRRSDIILQRYQYFFLIANKSFFETEKNMKRSKKKETDEIYRQQVVGHSSRLVKHCVDSYNINGIESKSNYNT